MRSRSWRLTCSSVAVQTDSFTSPRNRSGHCRRRERTSLECLARRAMQLLLRPRRCPLQVHQVRQNLEGTQGSDDLVFTSARGTALYDSNIRKHWHRVSANLGLPSMPWHNLRHSAATIMLAQGVPIEVVSRVFGHASIRITADIYGHVSPETNRQAADAMSKALR